jgi:hypothetical protein
MICSEQNAIIGGRDSGIAVERDLSLLQLFPELWCSALSSTVLEMEDFRRRISDVFGTNTFAKFGQNTHSSTRRA